MEQLINAGTIFLMLFGLVGVFDGIYLHLVKYRLYSRPESINEHKMHTVQAFLFIPILFLLFYQNSSGLMLWLAAIFVVVEFAVEMMDVLEENQSRASLGGLSSLEYAVHVIAITFRTVAIALAFASKPLTAWSLASPEILAQQSSFASATAFNMMIGNAVLGALHVWLMQKKYVVQRPATITNALKS